MTTSPSRSSHRSRCRLDSLGYRSRSDRHVAEIQTATWPRFKAPRGRDSKRHVAEIARACGGRPAASHSRARRVRRRARPRGSLCPSAGRVTSGTGWTPSTWRSDQCRGYEDETHAAMLCHHARCVRKEGHDQSDLFDSSTIGRRRRRHRPDRRGGSRSACVVTGNLPAQLDVLVRRSRRAVTRRGNAL